MANIKKIFESLTGKRMFTVQTINKDYYSNSYIVNETYFLRVHKPFIEDFVNFSNEEKASQDLKKSHLDFYPVGMDLKGNRITIYEPLVVQFDPNKLTLTQLKQITYGIKIIHSTPTTITDEYDYNKRLILFQTLSHGSIFNRPLDRRIKNYARKYLNSADKCLCHNNMNSNNILFLEDEIRIIEYEYATKNDPLYDIVMFIANCNITKLEYIEYILKNYYGRTYNQNILPKVLDYYQMIDYLKYFEYLYIYQITQNEEFNNLSQEKRLRLEKGYFILNK